MQTSFRLFAGIIALSLSAAGWAGDSATRTAHAKGEPAETLQQAVTNMREYNAKLEALLAKDELTAMDMHEVHMLTYTLENALQKIQADLVETAEVLEEVHIASETGKPEVVKEKGQVYLQATGTLVP
ncbi:hypothetical protein QAO71_16605 [Halopseudomonas sp. SMJS2]|uniref:DUF6746 family protein n=1 Tax=Halopseudomonas sp. SMJS2 TaxID=3041098 RepID=UPI0004518555|nr:DUF6746 family protein [Halopseudomonas sp. SMJS2]EZQ18110.1 hypothetical protein CF98_25775 [Halopseudomonas bauzanensis]WGK61641.1 hypothetical protein QAO71_16605 [Halopseudomonas sp. SMJS2]